MEWDYSNSWQVCNPDTIWCYNPLNYLDPSYSTIDEYYPVIEEVSFKENGTSNEIDEIKAFTRVDIWVKAYDPANYGESHHGVGKIVVNIYDPDYNLIQTFDSLNFIDDDLWTNLYSLPETNWDANFVYAPGTTLSEPIYVATNSRIADHYWYNTGLKEGWYTVEVIVYDNAGKSAISSQTIWVEGSAYNGSLMEGEKP